VPVTVVLHAQAPTMVSSCSLVRIATTYCMIGGSAKDGFVGPQRQA
jgi:hypothetical protein